MAQATIYGYNVGMLSDRMSEVALHHKVDEIANAYARVSVKLEDFGAPFADELSPMDLLTIRTFIANYIPSANR